MEGMEEAAKTAKQSAESVSKSGEKLGKTGAFRAISQVRAMGYTLCFKLIVAVSIMEAFCFTVLLIRCVINPDACV